MEVKKLLINASGYPASLRHAYSPPQQLFIRGNIENSLNKPMVSIVGTRKISTYGRQVTTNLASDLAKQGIVVVSGLALGVDALAHQAALDAGGLTIAVLPGSVTEIYPRSHHALAERIVRSGGALISEYPENTPIYKQSFVARNRIVAALSDALLITEASEKSSTLQHCTVRA